MRNISISNNKKYRYIGIKALFAGVILTFAVSLLWDIYSLNLDKEVAGTGTINNIQDPFPQDQDVCDPEDIDTESIIQSFSGNKKWLLKGNEFSQIEKDLTLIVNLEDLQEDFIPEEAWKARFEVIGTGISGPFTKNGNQMIAILNADDLSVGTYDIMATINYGCGEVETDPYEVNVSYPVYVTWTQDWEGTDVNEKYLNDMSEISEKHGISMTHFFNPRIYVTNAITPQRAAYLTNWVIRRTEENGDDIGLHLHMFPDMVEAAGVKVNKNAPAWGQRNDGYDVTVSGYSEDDLVKVLNWSKEIFVQNGLGDPIMFRAGGWYADLEALRALERTGFALDSSGRTKYSLGANDLPGFWDLSSTTNPYQPSKNDQNSSASPNMDIWEFPNNGADSTNHKYADLISRFNDNYSGEVLEEKRIVTFLSHPHWFHIDKPEIDKLFGEIDKSLYESDNGPVIYTTLSESYRIWTLPNE